MTVRTEHVGGPGSRDWEVLQDGAVIGEVRSYGGGWGASSHLFPTPEPRPLYRTKADAVEAVRRNVEAVLAS